MIQSFATPLIELPDSRQLLEQLYRERTLQPFRSGQTISLRPNELWVVCRGVVVLNTLHPTGDEALLGVATPSMPFGLPLTWITPYNAIALTDVDLLPLTVAEVERSPALCQGLFRHLSRRLQQAEAFLALSGCRRVEERLKQLLILLQHEVGQPAPRGTRLQIRLTHQQLANAIGTTRVTVTRLIGQLKQEGWLAIDAKRHIILH
ncbi:Crp/Fnr family transcriptional regulator [Leptolyngbya sp. NIES-2104]|uniref:Crp/Fnr family transcriptional regulator n=1 Tax=Leptolyngbya sp. NIES-2104 TaxID=1552121 RepID=UPI0006EC8287|nr:Crp/Fnr family transcriptional regulator [Leptolyngbya sp. NIES-2104]GAP99312.1 transcriptional regulator, Crp/Fnr family [Leptolyngbya sp. NIES-2104]